VIPFVAYDLLGRRLGYPTLASLRRVGVLSFPNRDQTHVQEKVSVGHIDEDGNDIKLCDGWNHRSSTATC
jgi:hypothetical protein